MKFTAILALAASASAFTPAPVNKAQSALSASAEGLPGCIEYVGLFVPLVVADKESGSTSC